MDRQKKRKTINREGRITKNCKIINREGKVARTEDY